jgi:uncharacterized protein YciI
MQKQIEISGAKRDRIDEINGVGLVSTGKVLKAGPFEDYSGRNVRGMFILKTSSLDEARAWVATVPAVKAGRLGPEFLKWYADKSSLRQSVGRVFRRHSLAARGPCRPSGMSAGTVDYRPFFPADLPTR